MVERAGSSSFDASKGPNANVYAERFVPFIKDARLSLMIFFVDGHLPSSRPQSEACWRIPASCEHRLDAQPIHDTAQRSS